MKKVVALLLNTLLYLSVYTQTTAIPDANFEQSLINLGLDTGIINGTVPTSNIDTVTILNVNSSNISDLTGIADFSALKYLTFSVNLISSVDVTQNTALEYLNCQFNQLSNLNITQNPALTYLNCGYNLLSSLDLSQNTFLNTLTCNNNQLTTLNVTQNIALSSLPCNDNQLTNIDVSANTLLTTLYCNNNQLNSLNVSQNTLLTTLYCFNNQLNSLNVSQNTMLTTLYCFNNQLNSLNVSQNTMLNYLATGDNSLTYLNVKNGNNVNFILFNTTNNPNLFCIQVDDSAYSTANWTNVDPQSFFSTNCSVGINEMKNFNEQATIYPNPASSFFNIDILSPDLNELYLVQLIDVTGKVVQQESIAEGMNKINFNNLPKGYYSVVISNSSGIFTTKKLVIIP